MHLKIQAPSTAAWGPSIPQCARHWLAGPDRARFACGIVADGEHEIHDGGIPPREFCPALRALRLTVG